MERTVFAFIMAEFTMGFREASTFFPQITHIVPALSGDWTQIFMAVWSGELKLALRLTDPDG
jgi:hypothetical protein